MQADVMTSSHHTNEKSSLRFLSFKDTPHIHLNNIVELSNLKIHVNKKGINFLIHYYSFIILHSDKPQNGYIHTK